MKLEITPMKPTTLKTTPLSGRTGFTAIEIAMVAAVIAILSLIVLPIFRNRVEDAKIAAAQADLNALMKAEQVVKADIDAYARLEDLDNVELNGYTASPAAGVDKEVPFFKYIKPRDTVSPDPQSRHLMTTQLEREQLAGTPANPVWRGPYIAFQRFIMYEDLTAASSQVNQNILFSASGDEYAAIQDRPGGIAQDSDQNRIPTDPWGNPYLFFPPNGNAADPNGSNGAYASAAIYSMGPDGMPGDGGTAPATFTRGYAVTNPTALDRLGAGDDLMVEF
jgi:type II secretory pathway pseudopilin PulG